MGVAWGTTGMRGEWGVAGGPPGVLAELWADVPKATAYTSLRYMVSILAVCTNMCVCVQYVYVHVCMRMCMCVRHNTVRKRGSIKGYTCKHYPTHA